MPKDIVPEMPILPRPSIRQVEWCLGFIRAHAEDKTLNQQVLRGVLPDQFIDPLIELALTDISSLSPQAVVRLFKKKPEVLDKLTMPEINAISFTLWQESTPELVARMYERILTECSPDEAAAIHKNAVEQIYAKAEANNNQIQLCGKATEKKVIDRKSTRLNSSHIPLSRMPSSA